jgi:selenide,water dikinase
VQKLVRNSTGRPGDLLYLTKPIGNGILISAFRALSGRRFRKPPSMDEAIRWMLMLNEKPAEVMTATGATAATDVTGYGLIGHLLEMCVGANVGAEINVAAVPVLAGARESLARGFRPAGTERNLVSFRSRVKSSLPESELTLLCDAQTSGGLLIAIAPSDAAAFERSMAEGGLFYARIGRMTEEHRTVTLVP